MGGTSCGSNGDGDGAATQQVYKNPTTTSQITDCKSTRAKKVQYKKVLLALDQE